MGIWVKQGSALKTHVDSDALFSLCSRFSKCMVLLNSHIFQYLSINIAFITHLNRHLYAALTPELNLGAIRCLCWQVLVNKYVHKVNIICIK